MQMSDRSSNYMLLYTGICYESVPHETFNPPLTYIYHQLQGQQGIDIFAEHSQPSGDYDDNMASVPDLARGQRGPSRVHKHQNASAAAVDLTIIPRSGSGALTPLFLVPIFPSSDQIRASFTEPGDEATSGRNVMLDLDGRLSVMDLSRGNQAQSAAAPSGTRRVLSLPLHLSDDRMIFLQPSEQHALKKYQAGVSAGNGAEGSQVGLDLRCDLIEDCAC